MRLKYSVQTAVSGLKTNKSRAFLTILGIVIGITAIIIVMSVSQGGASLILGQIQGIGSRTISIEPGREPRGPADFAEIFTTSIGERELEALSKKGNVPDLLDLTPQVVAPSTLAYGSETFRSSVVGTGPLWEDILDIRPEHGSFITEDDVRERASVVIIGSRVTEELFGEESAVGKKIKIRDRTFRVVGVFEKKGQWIFNIDEMAIIPYTTAQHYLLGISHFNSIIGRARSEDVVNRTVEDIKLTLRELHDIDDPDKDDFHVGSQADIANRVGIITGILSGLLVSVAGISLLVGGIGIMNIMLVSVTERTREIGLRKAVGATSKDILLQFLVEATVLTLIGGVVGIILGALFSFAISAVLARMLEVAWPFLFPLSAAGIGFAVSASVGLVFGLYPARQAAKKSPIDALRYE